MTDQRPDISRPDDLRAVAVALFRAAVAAVEPAPLVQQYVRRCNGLAEVGAAAAASVSWSGSTLVVGAGKAAAGMAAACEAALAPHLRGEVIVPDGCGLALAHVGVTEAGHPLPDERGHAAASRLLDVVGRANEGGILCLISGGASSLMVCPRPPLTLADKISTTKALLACGADIREFNTVRKHLSLVKGGGLLARSRLPVMTLMISDVVGDDPAVIGSGPTTPDLSTHAEACAILAKYGLLDQVPVAVRDLLEAGAAGRVGETLKPTDPAAWLGRSLVIASNSVALCAAAEEARARGWEVEIEAEPLVGDTTAAAQAFASRLLKRRGSRGLCILAGGETTVQVRGTGRGGRNQEFALAIADQLAGERICVLSAGTDGIDGPTPAAGAFVDGATMQRAHTGGLSLQDFRQRNDSFSFFSRIGDVFVCGPTGTNVMDLKIALLSALP